MPLPANGSLSLQGPSRLDDTQGKPKRAMLVRLSAEAMEALEDHHTKMEFDFGENTGLYIGDAFFPVRAQEEHADHELYLRMTSANKPGAPLKLYANVIGKFIVQRQLNDRNRDEVRERAQQAEKQRLERKTLLLETPPVSRPPAKSAATKKRKEAISVKKVVPPEPRMLSAASSSQPSRITSPRPPATTDQPSLKERLIHCAALQDRTSDELVRMLVGVRPTPAQRREVLDMIPQVLEQIPAPKNSINTEPKWTLKLDSWRQVRPYDWAHLDAHERTSLARKTRLAFTQLRIPESDPIWDRARHRDLGNTSDAHRASPVPLAGSSVPKRPIMSQPKKVKTADGSAKRKAADTITAKDESVKVPKAGSSRAQEREREEPTRPNASSSATPLSAVRRVPGSGFRTKSHSATPPLDPLTAAPPAVKSQDFAEPRQVKRDVSTTSSSSRQATHAAEDRRAPSDSGVVRKRQIDSAASRVADSDRERGRNSPLPSAGQKRKVPRDGMESDYSERDSVTASSKKRRLEERDRERERESMRAERDRQRDLSLPKKPIKREASPLPPLPKQKIPKHDASPAPARTQAAKRQRSPSPAPRTKVAKRAPSPSPVPKIKAKHEPSPSPALSARPIPPERLASVASNGSTRSRLDVPPERNGTTKSRRKSFTWTSSSSDEKEDERKPEPERKRRDVDASPRKAKQRPPIPTTLPDDAEGLRKLWKLNFPDYMGTYNSLSMARAKIEKMMYDGLDEVSSGDEQLLDVDYLKQLRTNFDEWTKDMERIAQKLADLKDTQGDAKADEN